jgi:hypothetical protein
MNTHTQLSLRPARPFLDPPRDSPGCAFACAVWAAAKNASDDWYRGAEAYVEERWPSDRQAIALARAATNPTTTATTALSPTTTADFIASLTGQSASARLIAAGVRLSPDGISSVQIPHRNTNLPDATVQFVAEAGVFPIRQYVLASSQLGPPHKLICSATATRESYWTMEMVQKFWESCFPRTLL